MLGVTVVRCGVDRHHIGGAGARGTDGESVGRAAKASGIPLEARQGTRCKGENFGSHAAISANRLNRHHIGRVGGKAGKQQFGVGQVDNSRADKAIGGEAVTHHIAVGGRAKIRVGFPGNLGGTGGGSDMMRHDGRAGGHHIEGDIIHIAVVVAARGLRKLEGHAAVRTVVVAEQHLMVGIGGGAVGIDGFHRHKAACIGRIGHHTHHNP